jgi:transcriptional regulator with XRE-family HTH domain
MGAEAAMGDPRPSGPRRFGRPRLLPLPPRRPLDDPDASFADLLCGFRQRLGWAQTALGTRAGVNASYINRLESGGRGVPTAEVVRALAAGLDLSPEETDRLLWSAGCLPASLRRLPCGDPTILAVARLLADPALSPEALADFRACVEAMARRWQGDPH